MSRSLKELLEATLDRELEPAELAFAVKLSVASVNRRERGDIAYTLDEYKRAASHFGLSFTELLVDLDILPYDDAERFIKGSATGMTVERASDYELASELADRLRPPTERPAHWGRHVPYPQDDYDLAASDQPDDDDPVEFP